MGTPVHPSSQKGANSIEIGKGLRRLAGVRSLLRTPFHPPFATPLVAPCIHYEEKKDQKTQPQQDYQSGFGFPQFLETPYKRLHGP
jgi:hypothetical protein